MRLCVRGFGGAQRFQLAAERLDGVAQLGRLLVVFGGDRRVEAALGRLESQTALTQARVAVGVGRGVGGALGCVGGGLARTPGGRGLRRSPW